MKKLEYKLLPCVFCTIGLNTYIAGNNVVHAIIKKLTKDTVNLQSCELLSIQTDSTPITSNTPKKTVLK